MIIGIGTDIVQIKRIATTRQRFGENFVQRILTPNERTKMNMLHVQHQDAFLAKRYAGKEAIVKALGCGIGSLATWQEIEILNDSKGAPTVRLTGKTAQTLQEKAPCAHICISLSDDLNALAFVVIESTL